MVNQIGPETNTGPESDVYPNSWLSLQPPGTPVGAAITAPAQPGVFLLNQATGSVLTLPPSTGNGKKIRAIVTKAVTSNKHAVLVGAAGDVLIGVAIGGVAAGGSMLVAPGIVYPSASATGNKSIQMPASGTKPSGGEEGDEFEFTDISAGVWKVTGLFQSGTTSATPFSTATT